MKLFKRTPLVIINAVLLCLSVYAQSVDAQTLIVVGALSPFVNLTDNQAKNIWLGEKKRLSGVPFILLDQIEGPTQQEFYKKLLGKTPEEIELYWKITTFTGKTFAPTKLRDDLQVKEWLSLNPLAIGYIDAKSADASIRVLLAVE